MSQLQLKLRIRFRSGVERIGVFGAFTGQSYPDLWEVLWGGELIASFRSWGDAVAYAHMKLVEAQQERYLALVRTATRPRRQLALEAA
ncbi:hypothetical protein [Corynebacterium matruchotii]|uniref:hypothetical protein n=1 Tax=Corynebacterium matruchotii TaxID=43768 RepID=UPI0028E5B0FF|nr:hypothetical protein [Corynebacterium matruchotii]